MYIIYRGYTNGMRRYNIYLLFGYYIAQYNVCFVMPLRLSVEVLNVVRLRFKKNMLEGGGVYNIRVQCTPLNLCVMRRDSPPLTLSLALCSTHTKPKRTI